MLSVLACVQISARRRWGHGLNGGGLSLKRSTCMCVVAFGFPAQYDAVKALGPLYVYRCFAALY